MSLELLRVGSAASVFLRASVFSLTLGCASANELGSEPEPKADASPIEAASPPSSWPDSGAPPAPSKDATAGAETGSDAGVCGAKAALPCADGEPCTSASDCASGVCAQSDGASSLCTAANCQDGVENGSETDLDCGGGCGPCAIGKHCAEASDCGSSLCQDGTCCGVVSYQKSTGFTSSGTSVCCDAGDQRSSSSDCGSGDNHWVSESAPNCAVAYEGSGNYGGPCATVSCTKLSCTP